MRAWVVTAGLSLVLVGTGCDWEYFYEGDSYTFAAVDDFTELGGCPVAQDRTVGAKSLVTMVGELPDLQAALREASSPPLVFFTAGAVDSVYYDPFVVTTLLNYWVEEVLSTRPDVEVIQFNYFGTTPYIDASRYRQEPRWTLVEFPEREASGYVVPGVDAFHLDGRSLTRRVALFFRKWPGYTCAISFAGTVFPSF